MYSRTYDAQRFSPLKQITRQNVGQLRQVFKKELGMGNQESIPIVYRGVLYVAAPGASVLAVDATTGATIWEHKRPTGASRTKAIAIYDDMVFYSSPDGFIVALDARTGRGEVGNEIERQPDLRRDCRRRQGALRPRLWNRARQLLHLGARCENRKRGVALLHRARRGRAGRRDVGRGAGGRTAGVAVGAGGRLRSGAAADFLGHRQSDAEYAGGPPRRQRQGDSTVGARGSVQQFDRRAQSRYRKAGVVLPASAWRRLGSGLHERTRAGPDGGQPRSEVRQMDQSGHSPRPDA